jgi:hypothetical protein
MMQLVCDKFKDLTMIYYFSDEAVSLYKIRKKLFSLYSLNDDFGMYVECHFFAA